ncbi:MAG: copper oxidase, partial [Nitrosopumilaceae archaeon]
MRGKMFVSLIVVGAASTIYFTFLVVNIDAAEEPKTFLTHSGAVIQTTGDVIDPVGYSGDPLEFNPDKYLRE